MGRELCELAACKHEEEGHEACVGKDLCKAWVMQEGKEPYEEEKERKGQRPVGRPLSLHGRGRLCVGKETVQACGPGLAIRKWG